MSMWIAREDPKPRLNCRQALRLLQAYLDGALDETVARHVAQHVETCRRCGREAESYQKIKNSLGRLKQNSPRAVQQLRKFCEALLEDPEKSTRTQRSVGGRAQCEPSGADDRPA